MILQKCVEEDGELSFLARFILDTKLPLKWFAKMAGLSYNLMYRWFAKDDIKISAIYLIAEKMDQTVVWKIRPLDPEKAGQ